jgi:hypothetical protein
MAIARLTSCAVKRINRAHMRVGRKALYSISSETMNTVDHYTPPVHCLVD